MTRKSMVWMLGLLAALFLVAFWQDDPGTSERYELENAASKSCRDAVRSRADIPEEAEFKFGWRQKVDPEARTVILEGRVGLMTVSGDTVAHAYRCLYDDTTKQATLLELRPDRSRLQPLR